MKTKFLTLIFLACLSCSRTDEGQTSSPTESVANSDTTPAPDQTVLNFLNWYKNNGRNLANNLVLNSSGENWDSTKFYAVNFPATETYLKILTSTNMLSGKYADKWRDYFKKCDQNFKANPQNDGPPEGFEYDFIVFSQEDPGLDDLSKAKFEVTERSNTQSHVLVKFPSDYQYKYWLSKDGQFWKIDDIEPLHK